MGNGVLGVSLLIATLALLWFGGLDHRKLADPDEGRYAEIPREMVESGDWVTPRLNALKYFEKPPLQYWATALAYRAFGIHDWTARLWPALTGFLGILLTWFAGRRLFGAQAGLSAAAVLASSVYYVAFAHIATLDMGLTLFSSIALFGFVLAMKSMPASRGETGWMLAAWAGAGGAMLSKGLIAVALPGLTLIVYSLAQRDVSVWRRLHPIKGVLVFLAICAPWLVMVSLANPEFPRFFFLHEHFDRFTSTSHHRAGPLWYFIPILLIGLLPWTWLVLEAVRDVWRKRVQRGEFSSERFLLAWIATVLLFFSASASKLPAYVLPIVPALALLTGARVRQLDSRRLLYRVVPVIAVAAVGLFIGNEVVEAIHNGQSVFPLYEEYARWPESATVLMLVTATAVALSGALASRRLLLVAAVMLLSVQFVLLGFESLSPLRSAYALAQEIRPHLKPGTQVFSVGRYDQSLPPYLRRTVVLVSYTDELEFGIRQEPNRWLESLEDFERAWTDAPSAVAVMNPDSFAIVLGHGVAMTVLSQSPDRVVVAKPK